MATGASPTRGSTGDLTEALLLRPGPVTEAVGRTAQGLEAAILQTQTNLQALVSPHTADIERQVGHADDLSNKAAITRVDLNDVENDFDANQPKNVSEVSHFFNVITTRQTSQDGSLLADITLKALKLLRASYERLQAVEDAVWSGRSAAPETLQNLESIGEIDGLYVSGEATQKLYDRGQLLESLVKEQLSTAWSATFKIEHRPDGLLMTVAESITLPPPKATRVTLALNKDPAPNQTYTVAELINALRGLGILDQLLSQLQDQMLRELVAPLVTSRSLVSEGYNPGDKLLRLERKEGATLTEIVSCIRDLVRFTEDALSCPLEAVNLFLSSFREALYQRVLREVVIPSMPYELGELPPWLSDVGQCASWEKESAGDSNKLVLQSFLEDQAGSRWLMGHEAEGLLETRSLVFDGWKDWDFRLEEVNPTVYPRTEEKVGGNTEGDDDGWGFDDELQPHDPPASNTSDDGWDFDDTTSVPADPVPTLQAKPAREAKRLGKKLSSKHASAAASQEALVDNSGAQTLPSRQDAHSSGVTTPNSSVRISVAADAAMSLLKARLAELQDIESLRLPDGLQTTIRQGLRSQLSDVLDFVRATLPIAHQHTLRSKPTTSVQLGNDFHYLASQMLLCEPAVVWPMRNKAAAGYVAAASVTYQIYQVQEQRKIRSMFQGTNHFVDLSEDNVYHQAESTVTELLLFVTDAANQLKPLVDDHTYHEMVGALVETISVLVVDSVLAMDDITEVESQRIESLIKKFESLRKLFRNDNLQMSSVATFAPHWLKMCYTSELLRANLAEISQLYKNGSLLDFTSTELSKLVRALFADSQKRAAVLEMIHR